MSSFEDTNQAETTSTAPPPGIERPELPARFNNGGLSETQTPGLTAHSSNRQGEEELREAKSGDVKTMFWRDIRDINWGISRTKTNNAEFINCMTPSGGNENYGDNRAEDNIHKNENTKATVKLEELMLVYPSSMQRTWIDLDRSS
ncbi:hypothetical protein D0864_12414 [Hortaea werneckii]|uniref:Uncharacterized protein n=1 Tax=Hortaea werneckii TaxID=91943 RepID=A0A3M7DIS1_HORWE|nr:hypothetical protein D0864_12414 [Hortaea werneckii]